MSQEDILKFIKKNKDKWYTAKDLAIELKINLNTAQCNLRRLRRAGFVDFIQKDSMFYYKPSSILK